jgi:hypothetical protein
LIVIYIDDIENFVSFLDKRVMNEVFYEIKQSKSNDDLSSEIKTELIIHFLSKVEEFIVLFETKVVLSKTDNSYSENSQKIITELQNIFRQVDSSITLMKGKIREIYLSYSS